MIKSSAIDKHDEPRACAANRLGLSCGSGQKLLRGQGRVTGWQAKIGVRKAAGGSATRLPVNRQSEQPN